MKNKTELLNIIRRDLNTLVRKRYFLCYDSYFESCIDTTGVLNPVEDDVDIDKFFDNLPVVRSRFSPEEIRMIDEDHGFGRGLDGVFYVTLNLLQAEITTLNYLPNTKINERFNSKPMVIKSGGIRLTVTHVDGAYTVGNRNDYGFHLTLDEIDEVFGNCPTDIKETVKNLIVNGKTAIPVSVNIGEPSDGFVFSVRWSFTDDSTTTISFALPCRYFKPSFVATLKLKGAKTDGMQWE